MRFQVTHKLTTYALVLVALGALSAAGLLDPSVATLAIAAGALSWFVDPGTRVFAFATRINPGFRLAAALFFGITAYRVWRHLPEPDLTPILNLVVFLLVYKLFQRSANRDYLQIYVLAFLMVLAGAAFAQSFVFVPAFVAYVVLTTWTLILLHLRREMEENYLVKHGDQGTSQKVGVARILNSRRVVGGAFLLATAGVAMAVVVGATITFAIVPRVGTGFAFGGQRTRRTLIGFSDEVTLGTSGFLSDENDTVALRAVLPRLSKIASDEQRDAEMDHLYWRGTVYDTYEKGRWQRSRSDALRTHIVESNGPSLIHEPHFGPPNQMPVSLADAERQEIDIVGVSAPVAFALDRPIAFDLPPPKFGALSDLRLIPRWSSEVAFHDVVGETPNGDPGNELRTFSGAHYIAYSQDPMVGARANRGRPLAQVPQEVLAPYLVVPTQLTAALSTLAKSITDERSAPIAKVIAISRWLESTHEYSTNLSRGARDRDPVDDFLFDRKSGHCEYFASAAALLLRSVGVPTRYVNGFLGGEWNAVGQYVTVRQNRAHAWVEAYIGEFGWMRVDATPPVRPPGRMGRLRQLIDSVDFLWGRWVVGYDLGRQIDIARNFGRGLGVGDSPSENRSASHSTSLRPLLVKGSVVVALIVGWRLVIRRRRKRRVSQTIAGLPHSPIGRLYTKSVERLAETGYPRRPAETAKEFSKRIRDADLPAASEFSEISELYVAARFGQAAISDDVVTDLAKRLNQAGGFRSARNNRSAA